MKKCPYCGRENADDVPKCPECGTTFDFPRASDSHPVPAEQGFWDRLTLKELALLLVKLQALWVLFPAITELTYLAGYSNTFFPSRRFDFLPFELKQTFHLALLRIALRVAAGIGVFVYAEQLLNWLAKGLIADRKRHPHPGAET
jgi:hypothetical protein